MNVQSYFEDSVEVKPNMEQEGKVHYTGGSKSDVERIVVQFYLCNHHHYHHFSCLVGLRAVLDRLHYYIHI
jgi:hypothetical protein